MVKQKPKIESVKRERIESKRNKKKIAEIVVKNPLLSQREIAKIAWVNVATVNNKLNQIQQWKKDPRILAICETDLEIVKLWQKEIVKRLKTAPDKVWVRDIVSAMESWTKRYTIFKGNITDENGWLKENALTEEQKKKIAERYLD